MSFASQGTVFHGGGIVTVNCSSFKRGSFGGYHLIERHALVCCLDVHRQVLSGTTKDRVCLFVAVYCRTVLLSRGTLSTSSTTSTHAKSSGVFSLLFCGISLDSLPTEGTNSIADIDCPVVSTRLGLTPNNLPCFYSATFVVGCSVPQAWCRTSRRWTMSQCFCCTLVRTTPRAWTHPKTSGRSFPNL